MRTRPHATNKTDRSFCNSRTLCILAAALISLLAAQQAASGATYYLDAVNGDDSNSGASAAPWRTLGRAYTWYSGDGAKVQEGDTVILRSGRYEQFVEDTNRGQSYLFYRTEWITYRGADGHTPILEGAYIQNVDKWHGQGDGSSYLRFEGLHIEGSVTIKYSTHVELRACHVSLPPEPHSGYYAPYIRSATYGILTFSAEHVLIEDCDIINCYRGIYLDGKSHLTARRNVIHHIGCDGIRFGNADQVLLEDNRIYDISKQRTDFHIVGTVTGQFTMGETVVQPGSGAEGVAVRPTSSGLLVYQTNQIGFNKNQGRVTGRQSGAAVDNLRDVDDAHRNGIECHTGRGSGIVIRRNTIEGDFSAIEIFGGDGVNDVTLENNLIWGRHPTARIRGIVLEGDTDVKMRNNTVVNAKVILQNIDAAHAHTTTVTEFYNNIVGHFLQQSDYGSQYIRVIAHGNNIFGNDPDDKGGPSYPFRRNSTELINTVPRFLDAQNGDFHLVDGSVAVGFGDPAHQPADSLGTVGPDGFLLNNGPARNATYHSAGSYEYTGAISNRAPILNTIGNKVAEVGQGLTFQIAANDSDGDPITYAASGLPIGASLSGQTFSWTPSADQLGSHEITFTASDGQTQDSETITIAVRGQNAAPVLAAIGDKSINENAALSFSIRGTDADGDALTYSANNLPGGASFAGQSFRWTPTYDQAGSYDVTFVASDGHSQDSETITIAVANVNRAPTLSSIGDQTVDETEAFAFAVAANDPDGDELAYSASGLPAGASFTGQNFNWTPTTSQVGSHTITFTASDGDLADSETITVLVARLAPDDTPPVVARSSPAPDAIQVPLNNLVTLHITDAGRGVDAETVMIQVNDQTVYQGDEAVHTSASGRCHRSGSKADYRFIYQPDDMSDFDQAITVRVNAADRAGNVMSEYSYSFITEMRAFGVNKPVSSGAEASRKGSPATASDAAGNIWAVWHAGPDGDRDIHAARVSAGEDSFGAPLALTTASQDQCDPDCASSADGKLYVVWQDNRRGNWDIFMSVCADGRSFSRELQVTDSDDNEVNPAVIIDPQSPNRIYVAWQDDRNGNQDVYIASTTNAFVDGVTVRVTSNAAGQIEPDLAVNAEGTVYAVWTDARNGQADIYGAASDAGPWTNVPIVTTAGVQTRPVIAAASDGTALHLLWVDDAPGDSDIHYAELDGLPDSPVIGSSIVDDTSGADQVAPAIACAGDPKVFACWQDSRHARGSGDTDLYCAEVTSGAAGTNVLIGDGGTRANQSEPAIGVDGYGHPYVVWADDRDNTNEIYYAATTFIDPGPLDSKFVVASAGATIGTVLSAIDEPEDVSIVVPPQACQADMRMTISKILNPQILPVECLGSYDFGPSGIEFDRPVTVTIPYIFSGSEQRARPYWYDSLTGMLSQQGITDIENIVVASDLSALRFKTTHFTPFYLVAGDAEDTSMSISGGGCSISVSRACSPQDLIVPYAMVALVMITLRRRDRRRRELLHGMDR